jgi:hypothetical protein
MIKLIQETISFKDAMDNLARLSTLDLGALPRIGLVGKTKIVTDDVEFPEVEVLWLSAEGSAPLLEVFDLTLQAVHEHLGRLVKEIDWEDNKSRHALEAIMALCGESAQRLEKYLEIRIGKKISLLSRLSFVNLQEDYARQVSKIQQDEPQSVGELKNLEVVRRDLDYELFYIRKEDGAPYFSTNLLRHMRLISDFESDGESFEEDPLLQVRSMMDRDLQFSAKQILSNCHHLTQDFYKMYKRFSNNDLAITLSQALMALLLAANPRNLLQNTTSKSCQQYFEDFLLFLRGLFRTDEYQKFVAYPPEKSDKIAHLLLNLAHSLAKELYTRVGGVKQEAVGLIHRTTRKGSQPSSSALKKGDTVWSGLSIDDENYRSRLAKFPSGPLFKTLDLVRFEEGEPIAFDPVIQGNIPMQLFEIHAKNKQIHFLKVPCPTRQHMINKAEILDEMRGFLRYYNTTSPKQKHLMINLQDRTSWKEFIRCKALEEMQKNAEFNPALVVVTLAKNTDFYSQANEYEEVDRTNVFFAILLKQLEQAEGYGFYFPSSFKSVELCGFAAALIPIIHRHFFEKKEILTRREREDFIEIFYQFIVLKLIDHYNPTTVSFTCKDAIDTGAAASALFFAFIHLLQGGFEEKQEIDYFRWLLYAPSLFVRERALDPERFNRVLTALERFSEGMNSNRKAIFRDLEALIPSGLFDKLSI